MKEVVYLYSQISLSNIIRQILFEYKVISLTNQHLNNPSFKNNNVLLVLEKSFLNEINELFFLKNNVVIFLSKNNKNFYPLKSFESKFFYGQITIKKFYDEIKTLFILKKIIFKNIEIEGDKITNNNLNLTSSLTPLEKEILVVLFQNKKIKRDYLLEEILKIKKDIETKTIESHLTRIRRKLLNIRSNLQISAKEDTFSLLS